MTKPKQRATTFRQKLAAQAAEVPQYDSPLFLTTAVLVIAGAIMVLSSSVIMAEARWHAPYLFVVKHIIWVALGTVVMLSLARYDYRKLQSLSRPLLFIALALLVAVIVIGTVKSGARRWFQVGPVSFQPSEFAKLVLVVVLADYLDRKKSRLKNWKGLAFPLGIIALFCGLIALEPDLGTPALMVAVSMSLLLSAGARLRHLAVLALLAVPILVIEIARKEYRIARVRDFFQSWGDIHSGSYQLNQSILALGSGGFIGKGLAASEMKRLFLPEPHTDFIFPIIGEELGFIGTVGIIGVFLFFAWRGWQISRHSRDYFGHLLALGITWLIIFQALFNMGVACGIFPTKGLPLPFVSFGGTALVFNMAGVGILLSISRLGGKK